MSETTATPLSPTSQAANREILRSIGQLYAPHEVEISKRGGKEPSATLGLRSAAALLNVPLKGSASRKATVMVIGNVSAGKSTFVNWYVQEPLQKTGMAVETSGFTFVTAGRTINELVGESALLLRPEMEQICAKNPGLMENFSVRTCPSSDGKIFGVDLIDTPGLADGELQYAFDVENIILDLAQNQVDLIICLFDPIGQALGTRLLNVVGQLSAKVPEKIRYCLSKSDEIKEDLDKLKIICQITQSLTSKIHSRHGFDLIPIFIPGAADGSYLNGRRTGAKEVNRIADVVTEIERATEHRIQELLASAVFDVKQLVAAADEAISVEGLRVMQVRAALSRKRGRKFAQVLLLLAAVALYVMCLTVHTATLGQYRVLTSPALALMPLCHKLHAYLAESPASPVWQQIERFVIRPSLEFLARDWRNVVGVWVAWAVLLLTTIQFNKKKEIISDGPKVARLKEIRNFLTLARQKTKNLQEQYLACCLDS